MSPEQTQQTEEEAAGHIGELQRYFFSGLFGGAQIENLDEAQFIIDMQSLPGLSKWNGSSEKWLNAAAALKDFRWL